jgi:DNA primase
MAKLAPTSIKYIVKASIKAKGVVEKPDVIGAIFGQTEGLLGSDLDLRELQRTGRIGRIEVNIKSVQGNSEGEIIIPSSLDAAETALIGATLETIERVGPCTAEITLISVEDTRSTKREYVMDRAQNILKGLMNTGVPQSSEVSEKIKEAVRTHEISTYHGLPCGPGMMESEEIIITEGRADVLNLLKYGIRNVIAIEGTSIPQAITDLSKEKTVTVFVDGDRGGELIVKEFMQKMDIDFVAVAPAGKEVEELSQKEVFKALRSKTAAEQFAAEKAGRRGARPRRESRSYERKDRRERPRGRSRDDRGRSDRRGRSRDDRDKKWDKPPALKPKQKEDFRKVLDELVGTRAACIFDEKNGLLGKVPVSELATTLETLENPFAVVFDGKVDFKLNSVAKTKGVKFLVGMDKEKLSSPVAILSKKDLE